MGTQLEFNFYKDQLGEIAPFPVLKKKWLEQVTGKTGTLPELEYFYAIQTGLSTTASIGSANKRGSVIPSWVPDNALAAYDASTNYRYGVSNPSPLFERASSALWNPDGIYQEYATNVLRRADGVGMLLEGARTNKCTNFNANPTDLTNVTKGGDAAATLTVVDDSAAIVAAGLSEICNGNVFLLDNTAGISDANAQVLGQVGNVNEHIASAYVRGSGQYRIGTSGGGTSDLIALTAGYVRGSYAQVPTSTGRVPQINASAGSQVYFILNQLEEASTASTPIITEGSAVTRAADEFTFSPSTDIGTYDLHARYDDDSTDIVASGVTGAHVIDPANLDRPGVKLLWAEPS